MAYGGAGPAAAGPMGHDMAPAAAYNYDRAYYRSNDWLRFVPRRSFVDTNSSGATSPTPRRKREQPRRAGRAVPRAGGGGS
ncbi:hypothetical protein THAOC_08567, partial [Thalassiosira oceanica]